MTNRQASTDALPPPLCLVWERLWPQAVVLIYVAFAASLNRILIITGVVLLVWYFFREFASPWRYLIYPRLIALSPLHLSAIGRRAARPCG